LQLTLLVIQVLLVPADMVLMATTRHYGYAAWAVIEGLLNLTLSLWWVQLFGLPGVIAATVAARLLTIGWYIQFAAFETLQIHFWRELKRLVPASAVSVVAIVIVAALWQDLSDVSAAESVVVAAVVGAVFALAYVLVALSREERAAGIAFLGGIWRAREAT
jgi:O-antigen/teichoic acid export membrane protein